jgi:hypothetical protein
VPASGYTGCIAAGGGQYSAMDDTRSPASAAPKAAEGAEVMDRERLCNDILNTGVMGALIGGFALSNLQMDFDTNNTHDIVIYLASFIGVHACTCSCITSALLYRVANRLSDNAAEAWAADNSMLLLLPMGKFGMGCLSYLLSVIALSHRDLKGAGGGNAWRNVALLIGIMSMSITVMTFFLLRARRGTTSVRQSDAKLGTE